MTDDENSSGQRRPARLILVLLGLVLLLGAGCGREKADRPDEIRLAIPSVPATSDFGPLYPKVNADLEGESPDVNAALRDTIAWATEHLQGFSDGACGQATIVYDSEFARIFGRSTLGVTLPWMQLFIRDGSRDNDTFLWKDSSLFVSTVLHEFVHSGQRARQSDRFYGTHGCEDAHAALTSRRPIWNAGFDSLRSSAVLGEGFAEADRALLYRWISPIERARDEVDAALATVRWMHDHSDELSELTAGGANNWAYGVQFLIQLKRLGMSDCFSPDDLAYEEERKIYQDEIPQYIAEYAQYETEMKAFLTAHNISAARLNLDEARAAAAAPGGRQGSRCNSQFTALVPAYTGDIDLSLE